MPIDHAKLPVSDLDATRRFYAAVLSAFGYLVVWDRSPTLGFGMGDGGEDDEPIAFELIATPIARCHIAFAAASREEVERFHAAALAAGGLIMAGRAIGHMGRSITRRSSSILMVTTSKPSTRAHETDVSAFSTARSV